MLKDGLKMMGAGSYGVMTDMLICIGFTMGFGCLLFGNRAVLFCCLDHMYVTFLVAVQNTEDS